MTSRERFCALALALIALFAFAFLVLDDQHEGNAFGWDATLTCAGVDAYQAGLNPYYVKNLKDTKLSYSYPPFTFALFAPVCSHGFLARHFRLFYLALAVAAAFLVGGASVPRLRTREGLLKAIFVFIGFGGFQWALRCGNVAAIDGFFVAAALCLLQRGFMATKDSAKSRLAVWCGFAGAALLGFSTAIKVSYFPVLFGLYCLPTVRSRKIAALILALAAFALPLLASWIFQHDLFLSWLDCAFGRIPGQHSAATEGCNPSLPCLAKAAAGYFVPGAAGRADVPLYALFAAGILAPLFYRIIYLTVPVAQQHDWRSLPARLDRMLRDRPRFALHLTALAMLGLFLCTPRLKEYAYFEMAIYAAIMIGNLSLGETALVYAVGVIVPLLPGSLSHLKFYGTLWSGYGQLAAAVAVYFVFLWRLPAVFRRLESR